MKRQLLIVFLFFIPLTLNSCALLPLSSPDSPLAADDAARDQAWVEAEQAAREAAEKSRVARELAVEHGIRNRDVVLGMAMHDVREVWGEPTDVEVAGVDLASRNPAGAGLASSGSNERWVYATGLSSRWSLGAARVIYFEDGRVVGWETR